MKPEKKKRRRRSTFATALAQAKSRLQKAQQELEAAQKLVAALSVEIPLLRHTAEALERQINPPDASMAVAIDPKSLKWSAPPGDPEKFQEQTIHVNNLGEDDLLPEPEGQELLPES